MSFDVLVLQEKKRLEKLHPTPEDVPSCMKLLDDFMTCNILGSQLRSLYRYGHLAVCRPKLEDFKFCSSLRSLTPEDKRDAWINRRAEWWAQRRTSGSSEDVWEIRQDPLQDWPKKVEVKDGEFL